jgi:hypothetical protein
MTGASVLVAFQPGVFMASPGEPANNFQARLWDAIEDVGGWLFNPAGEQVLLWESGSQRVEAFDLTNPNVRGVWTDLLVNHFTWASGVHFDYFTRLDWLDPTFSSGYWTAYQEGWRDVVARIRKAREEWIVLGQEWHETPITGVLDGRFVEDNLTQFGLTFSEQAHILGQNPQHVVELRDPLRFPLWYRRETIRVVEEAGCFLSWGRDALAGVDLPR